MHTSIDVFAKVRGHDRSEVLAAARQADVLPYFHVLSSPALPVVEVLEPDLPVRIGVQAPLESLLGSEGLGRLGAMVAVDTDGVLQGVVTLAQVRQALRPAAGL